MFRALHCLPVKQAFLKNKSIKLLIKSNELGLNYAFVTIIVRPQSDFSSLVCGGAILECSNMIHRLSRTSY